MFSKDEMYGGGSPELGWRFYHHQHYLASFIFLLYPPYYVATIFTLCHGHAVAAVAPSIISEFQEIGKRNQEQKDFRLPDNPAFCYPFTYTTLVRKAGKGNCFT